MILCGANVLETSDFRLMTSDWDAAEAACYRPIAYCLLPIAYCLIAAILNRWILWVVLFSNSLSVISKSAIFL